MSKGTETIEISDVKPEKLSDEVLEELIEDLDEDTAEKLAQQVHLDEMDTAEPSSKRFVSVLKDKASGLAKYVKGKYAAMKGRKTVFAEIENVKPIESGVQLVIANPSGNKNTIRLDSDSKKLANLLEYNNTRQLSDLEGGTIMIKDTRIGPESSRDSYYVPNNMSISGRIRFGIFSALHSIREKTHVRSLDMEELFDISFSGAAISMIPGFIGLLLLSGVSSPILQGLGVLLSLPFAFFMSAAVLSIGYAVWHLIILIFRAIARGDLYEIETT